MSTNTLWTSFDCGTVEASNKEEARNLAIAKLQIDFQKANDALKTLTYTDGFSIHFDESQVEITEY